MELPEYLQLFKELGAAAGEGALRAQAAGEYVANFLRNPDPVSGLFWLGLLVLVTGGGLGLRFGFLKRIHS